jgi:4-methylaminobutanoate oxidase (formaldehyde-forming)
MGYIIEKTGVTPEFVAAGRFEIQTADRRVPARVSLAPMYDPKRERILT